MIVMAPAVYMAMGKVNEKNRARPKLCLPRIAALMAHRLKGVYRQSAAEPASRDQGMIFLACVFTRAPGQVSAMASFPNLVSWRFTGQDNTAGDTGRKAVPAVSKAGRTCKEVSRCRVGFNNQPWCCRNVFSAPGYVSRCSCLRETCNGKSTGRFSLCCLQLVYNPGLMRPHCILLAHTERHKFQIHVFEAQFRQRTSAAHSTPLLNSASSLPRLISS